MVYLSILVLRLVFGHNHVHQALETATLMDFISGNVIGLYKYHTIKPINSTVNTKLLTLTFGCGAVG